MNELGRDAVSEEPGRGRLGRRVVKLLVGLMILVGIGWGLRATVLAPKPIVVDVSRVDRGEVEETIANTRAGTVKVRRRAALSPQVGGRVVAIPVKEGDRVEEGTLLVRLDDSVQAAQVALAEEDIRTASARADEICFGAELAKKELDRQLGLHREGIAAEDVLDRAVSERDRSEAACRAARAGLDQARARREVARTELELTRIRAPFSGVIAEIRTEIGEWITPSPPGLKIPAIIDLLDPHSIYISAPIDEMDAERVDVGQAVRISVDSRRGQSFPGRVVRVAPYVLDVVEQNRTVEVEAEFDDAEGLGTMLPGTSADIIVVLERHENVLRVPSTAVADGKTVLVVADGVLEKRTVECGLGNWEMTEIVDGLDEGESVVRLPSSTDLKPGVRVEASR